MFKKFIPTTMTFLLGVVVGSLFSNASPIPISLPVTSDLRPKESSVATPTSSPIPKNYFDFDVANQPDTSSYVHLTNLPSSDVSQLPYKNEARELIDDEVFSNSSGIDPIVRDIDVNNDGDAETLVLTSNSEDNSPHQLYVIKDNQIIFETEPMSYLGFNPSPSKSGFYFYTTPNDTIGQGFFIYRIIWQDGKLIPVWQQRTHFYQYL